MVKIKSFLVLIMLNSMFACSQSNFGPGYKFDLFENTHNWDLAKAVESENAPEITKLIKSGNYDINLQETKYGRTLLLLAVGNDKYVSTKVLLENNANVNVRDYYNTSPICEATQFVSLKKKTLQILKLLIKYGANVNDADIRKKNDDTVKYYVPLIGATSNLECAKLLLENGANLYVKYDDVFPIWHRMLVYPFDENIFVAKYLIINKKMPIPNPIVLSVPKKNPQDIFYFLNIEKFRGDSAKEKAKQEILDYLRKIDFPKTQVYK